MFGDLPTTIISSEKKPPLHKNHGVLLEGSDVIFELPVTNRRTFFLTAQHSGASLACRCALTMGKKDESWKEIPGYNVVGTFFNDIWKIWNIYLKLCQNMKGQTFVELFESFFCGRQLIKIKKDSKKRCSSTNVWPFLFCQGFRRVVAQQISRWGAQIQPSSI